MCVCVCVLSPLSSMRLCWFCSVSFDSEDGFTTAHLGILFHSNSSKTSTSLWGSSCFSRARFLVKTKRSEDGEHTAFDAAKTGKFFAFSRMWSNTVCCVMILHSLSSALAAISSSWTLAAASSTKIWGKICGRVGEKVEKKRVKYLASSFLSIKLYLLQTLHPGGWNWA